MQVEASPGQDWSITFFNLTRISYRKIGLGLILRSRRPCSCVHNELTEWTLVSHDEKSRRNDSISCAFNLFRPTPRYASRAVWLKHTPRVWCTVPCLSTCCRIVRQQWLSFGRALDRWSVSGGEKRRVMNRPVSETETGIVAKNFCQVAVLKNKEHRGLPWLYH